MRNYWLSRKNLEITNVAFSWDAWPEIKKFTVGTSWGNLYSCWVKDGMLGSGIIQNNGDVMQHEEEWEMVERFAEKCFLATGQLKESIYEKSQPKVQS